MPSPVSQVSQTAVAPFVKGDLVAGKYVVERTIGVGGVGVVLAARHTELDEVVALKMLRPEALARPDLVRLFSREAKAAVRIKSEYAARVFDVGSLPDRGPFIVMEYLDGQDLGGLVEAKGPVSVRRGVEYVMQACEALAVAHSLGIVHRDIKPENLFLVKRPDGSDVVKVLDFGISKTALTGSSIGGDLAKDKTQELMGSPYYMSPEQFRGSAEVDHRTDIWSLGIVLYEILTGTQPFAGDSITAVCSAVLEESPKPLSAHMRDVPNGLQEVLSRCLEKDPAKRFQNVAEVTIALLPFAPSKAGVFAERTSGILHAADRSVAPYKHDSLAPRSTSGAPSSSVPSIPSAPAIPTFTATSMSNTQDIPTPSTNSAEAIDAVAREAQKTRVIMLALAAVAIAAAAVIVPLFLLRGGDASTAKKEAAPAATSAAPASVRPAHPVVVEAEPRGARVEWQGKLLGEAPGTFQLPEGVHEVTVSAAGYRPEKLAVTVVAGGESIKLRVTLQPAVSAKPAPVTPSVVGAGGARPAGSLAGARPNGARPPNAPTSKETPASSPPPAVETAAAAPAAPAPAPAVKVKTIAEPATHVKVIGEKKTDVHIVE